MTAPSSALSSSPFSSSSFAPSLSKREEVIVEMTCSEQTAILDAAALYLARMEGVYGNNNNDSNNNNNDSSSILLDDEQQMDVIPKASTNVNITKNIIVAEEDNIIDTGGLEVMRIDQCCSILLLHDQDETMDAKHKEQTTHKSHTCCSIDFTQTNDQNSNSMMMVDKTCTNSSSNEQHTTSSYMASSYPPCYEKNAQEEEHLNDNDDDSSGFTDDDSFYIGEEEGYCNSSSVHESDISETDSEAYSNNHPSSSVHDEDDDCAEEEEYVNESSSCYSLQDDIVHVNTENNDDGILYDASREEAVLLPINFKNDHVVGSLKCVVVESETSSEGMSNPVAKVGCIEHHSSITSTNESFPYTHFSDGISDHVGKDDDDDDADEKIVVVAENTIQATSSPVLSSSTASTSHPSSIPVMEVAPRYSATTLSPNSVAVNCSTTTMPSPNNATLQLPSTPFTIVPSSLPNTTSYSTHHDDDDFNYVSTSLKRTIYQQESELSHILRSIDALSSTPGRITSLCNMEFMEEDDYDESGFVNTENNDENQSIEEDENDRSEDHHELTIIKKRLLMDAKIDPNVIEEKELPKLLEVNSNSTHSIKDCVGEEEVSSMPVIISTPSPTLADVCMKADVESPGMPLLSRSDKCGSTLNEVLPSTRITSLLEQTPSLTCSQLCGSSDSPSLIANHIDELPPLLLNNVMSSQSSPSTIVHSYTYTTPPPPSVLCHLHEKDQTPTEAKVLDLNYHSFSEDSPPPESKTVVEMIRSHQRHQSEERVNANDSDDRENLEAPDTSIQELFRNADTLPQIFLTSPHKSSEEGCHSVSSPLISSPQVSVSHLVDQYDDMGYVENSLTNDESGHDFEEDNEIHCRAKGACAMEEMIASLNEMKLGQAIETECKKERHEEEKYRPFSDADLSQHVTEMEELVIQVSTSEKELDTSLVPNESNAFYNENIQEVDTNLDGDTSQKETTIIASADHSYDNLCVAIKTERKENPHEEEKYRLSTDADLSLRLTKLEDFVIQVSTSEVEHDTNLVSDKRNECSYKIIEEVNTNPNGDTCQNETTITAPAGELVYSTRDIHVDTFHVACGESNNAHDTFDTAIGSLGALGREYDHFFDARETIDDNTPTVRLFDGESEVVHNDAQSDAIENANATLLLEESNKIVCSEQAIDVGRSSGNDVVDHIHEIPRNGRKSEDLERVTTETERGDQIGNATTADHSVESFILENGAESCQRSNLKSANNSYSKAASNEHVLPSSNSCNLEDNELNESIFMPNISIDPTSTSSPKVPEHTSPTLRLVMTVTSEDESELDDNGDDEEEAFFPNDLDICSRTFRTQGSIVVRSSRTETGQLSFTRDNCAPVPDIASLSGSKQPGALFNPSRSLPSTRASIGRDSENKRNNPPPPRQENQKRIKSTVSDKRSDHCSLVSAPRDLRRKVPPTWSPPSAIKPAMKRSRSLNGASNSRVVARNESSKRFSLTGTSMKVSCRHRSNLPPVASVVRTSTGKENNHKSTVNCLKTDKVTKSTEQPLELITKSHSQNETNSLFQIRQKKSLDMERINRLAEPRYRRSIGLPPNDCTVSNVENEASSTAGPPSFLSRKSLSRRSIKSTAELEREEMERIKPFKARPINGSSTVTKSRYRTATKLPLPTQACILSNSLESESKMNQLTTAKPPPATKPSCFHHRRESGIYKPTTVRRQVQTFGESVQHYLNYGLRDSLPNLQIEQIKTTKPPSFLSRQSLSNNFAIKSSEDIELEECQKQFRARSISLGSTLFVNHSQGPELPVPCHKLRFKQQMELSNREAPRALTTPSPFRLQTKLRAECPRPPLPSVDDLELSKKFRALPLPNSSTSRFYRNGAIDTPYYLRAQQQYAVDKQRRESISRDVIDGCNIRFKARPVPRTTYEALSLERKNRDQVVTEPKPPRLSLSSRAEARKLFNQRSEETRYNESTVKQMQEQRRKEMEELEIQKQRRTYADEGGFCFKATPICIEYI